MPLTPALSPEYGGEGKPAVGGDRMPRMIWKPNARR
jgi:hypothetical protein